VPFFRSLHSPDDTDPPQPPLDTAALLALQKKDEAEYAKEVVCGNKLLTNLLSALRSAATSPKATAKAADNDGPDRKRAKTNAGKKATPSVAQGGDEGDAFKIMDSSFARGVDVDRGTAGAILMRLTPPGLVNALASARGGVVDPENGKILTPEPAADGSTPAAMEETTIIPTASNLTIAQLRKKSKDLHRAISARLEMDMMEATPGRVVEMMCPEVTQHEIMAIRRRIYDTVVLGRGTNSSASAAALEGGEDLPVAARVGVHDVEKFQRCKVCGNNDQSSFVMDRKNGDLICTTCGTVATESLMHEGSQFRKFEGEEDRNHHGDAPNPLYSNAHNMSTTLGGMSFQTGAGIGGFGSQRRQGMENILRNAHAYTEMNISQFGKSEKKTRIGYKDRQKKDAFVQMTHVGDALGLHEAVVQRAKELFAGFRDDRELVQQFKGVLASCLCEAFDQLSRDGRRILKMRTGEDDLEEERSRVDVKSGDPSGIKPEKPGNKRAAKRQEMHSANLAGTGGIFVGAKAEKKKEDEKESNEGGTAGDPLAPVSALDAKPAPKWDLDDCRNWLQEASKAIAKQWSEQNKIPAANKKGAPAIPRGTLEELEGMLIGHTLTLVDMLESEMKGQANGNGRGPNGARRKVVTPRVKDMGTLGIKWQHAHERGSGGKGGVGNNAQSRAAVIAAARAKGGRGGGALAGRREGAPMAGRGAAATGGRGRGSGDHTAGQVLILKSAKMLGATLKDPVAGEAFHRELRALKERQKARKQKELRDEAAQQRFKQMNRKPWLKARAEM